MTNLDLDNLEIVSQEEINLRDREYGMGALETVKKQLDLGLIESAKSTLETAILLLSK